MTQNKVRHAISARDLSVGDFVMLRPDVCSLWPRETHPDSGRIGVIARISDDRMVVQFSRTKDGKQGRFCMLPASAFHPVPRFVVMETMIDSQIHYVYSKRGQRIASAMGWPVTQASQSFEG